jgi:DNA-binding response OmpR family regulator
MFMSNGREHAQRTGGRADRGCGAEPVADLETYLARVGFDLRISLLAWSGAPPNVPDDADIVVLGDKLGGAEVSDVLLGSVRHGVLFLVITRPVPLVERVLMLESGAADVVDAPVHTRELAARIGRLAERLGYGRRETLVLERSTVDLKAALVMTRDGEEETAFVRATRAAQTVYGQSA